MICINCKKEIPESAKVCGYCGTKQIVEQAKKETPSPQKVEKPKRVKKIREPKKPKEPKKVREPKKRSFKWYIPVAIISAIVVIGAILLLVVFPAEPPSTPTDSSPQKDDPVTTISILQGTWSGDADTSDGGSFYIIFKMNASCKLEQKCGTFEVPEWDLDGDVIITRIDGPRFYFRVERVRSDGGKAEVEWLQYINANEIEYYSRGDYGISRGTLTKE